jgi:hypothetical protein
MVSDWMASWTGVEQSFSVNFKKISLLTLKEFMVYKLVAIGLSCARYFEQMRKKLLIKPH